MGSFIGHLVPGTAFTLFGLWYAYCILNRFYLSVRTSSKGCIGKLKTHYSSRCSYTFSCCPSVPVEGIFKVLATSIAFAGELATAYEDGKFAHIGNAQHMMMYTFFFIHGIADLAVYRRLPAPPNIDYMTAALAFFMQSFLFFTHLHGRSLMDTQVHLIVANLAFICGILTLLEATFKHHVLPALSRAFFIILQGTWFFQTSFLLFPPFGDNWEENSHEHVMLVTCIFTLHVVSALVILLAVGTVCYRHIRNIAPSVAYFNINSNSNLKDFSILDAVQTRCIIDGSDEEEQ